MKKILALILALAMAASLCACGSSSSSESEAASEAAEEVQEEPAEEPEEEPEEAPAEEPAEEPEEAPAEAPAEEPAEEPAEPEDSAEQPAETANADPDGVIYPQANLGVDYNYPIENADSISITASFRTFLTDVTDYSQFEYAQYSSEATGIPIEWKTISAMDYQDQLNLMLSSGDYTDMILGFTQASSTLASAYENDIIVNLTDYLEEYSPNYWALIHADGYEDILRDVKDDDGNFLCYWALTNNNVMSEGYCVRADMLEAVGITDLPTTYDGWEEALLAVMNSGLYPDLKCGFLVTEDTVSQYLAYGYDIPGLKASMGLYRIGDTVYSCLTEDAMRDYISMMSRWYDEGILDNDFISMDGDATSADQ